MKIPDIRMVRRTFCLSDTMVTRVIFICFAFLLFIDTETVNAFLCLRQFLRHYVSVLSLHPSEIR